MKEIDSDRGEERRGEERTGEGGVSGVSAEGCGAVTVTAVAKE